MTGVIAAIAAAKLYPPLTSSVGGGGAQGGASQGAPCGYNTCTAGGGSGLYSYSWHETDDGVADWSLSEPLMATTFVSVWSNAANVTSAMSLTCTVTDTVTGRTATSSAASPGYTFTWSP